MEVAADSKIWIWVVFMIISFAYNAWKKKNKARQEEESYEEDSASSNNPVDFGLEDLISQFEEQYGGGKKEPKVEKVEKRVVQSEVKTHEPQRVRETAQPTSRFSKNEKAFKTPKNNPGKKSDLTKKDKVERVNSDQNAANLDVDLRQMVIAQTVLERPKY